LNYRIEEEEAADHLFSFNSRRSGQRAGWGGSVGSVLIQRFDDENVYQREKKAVPMGDRYCTMLKYVYPLMT
jgi:hypothetical protein